jgi:hypothetical protein
METMRAIAKAAARPFVTPLIRRFRLLYTRIDEVQALLYTRIDEVQALLYTHIDKVQAQVAEIRGRHLAELRSQLAALRGSNENLTRAWLAQEAELRVQRAAQEATQQLMSEATQAAGQFNERAEGFEHRLKQENGNLRRELEVLRSNFAGASTRVDDTLKFLLTRVEFVRLEMLFEIQHSGSGTKAGPQSVVSRIANPERVSAITAQGLRLNVGCGHIPLDDYVNVDVRDLPGVDIVAEAGAIGVEPASVTEIFSSHLLEHFPQEALKRRILPHWSKLLREGGRLRAVVPDGDAMIRQYASGEYSFADLREVLFGAQDYQGDFHFNLFTPESLSVILTAAGYSHIEVPVRGRRNGQCFEFEISATKS